MRVKHDVTHSGSEEGFALVLTILVLLVVGALVTGAVVVGGNQLLANRYYERNNLLTVVADGGMELARARINGDPTLYPDSGYVTLENGVAVTDGAGNVIPGVKRWIYAGPTGVTSGQYGIFGSVVTIVRDDGGGEVIRRSQISQESFARFVYFTNVEGNIYFNGDTFFGPLHSNDKLKLAGSPSVFHNEVTTALTVQSPNKGTFDVGYEENVARVEMPQTADLNKVRAQATAGGTAFTGNTDGTMNLATTRIEFVAIDLNSDGDTTDDDEGFFKVYQSANEQWLSADYYDSDLRNNENCGRTYSGTFVSASNHPYDGNSANAAVNSGNSRCYLGGDELLTNGFVANDGKGSWLPWSGTQAPGLAGRPDAGYLFPLARKYNPNFKGVISVTGKVGVSGIVRGQVTVVATGDIVILDDLVYATDPGAGTCQDMMGLFAGDDIIVSLNLMTTAKEPWSSQSPRTFDDTGGEFIHSVLLALDQFGAGDYSAGATINEDCENQRGGRGCLYVTGGIIQRARGAVGQGWAGYWKRYSWDACAMENPPPYFPTTGRFSKGQYYNVDPVGFSVAGYFQALTPR